MPHIIILVTDEDGNTIGEIRMPHEEEGGNLTAQEPGSATIDLAKVAELLKAKKKDKG